LIGPKGSKKADYTSYDVTNGIVQDPKTGEDLNPESKWVFRNRGNVDPN